MASAAEAKNAITIRPEPACGAFIEDIDLREPLSDRVVKQLKFALHEHGVLFFRDQKLTPAEHAAFARQFGRNYIPPYSHTEIPEVPEVFMLTEADRGGAQWHTDSTFEQMPPQYSTLQSLVIPSSGGDTLWASMTKAYDDLSPRIKALLEGLTATHDFWFSTHRNVLKARKAMAEDLYAKPKTAIHPVVIRDPVTGRKSLYVNEQYTCRINELNKDESDAVLSLLFKHVAKPEFQVRLHWAPDMLVVWNNEVVQHYPTANYDEPRKMRRIVVLTDHQPEA